MPSDPSASLNTLIRKLESTAVLADEERHALRSLPVTVRGIQPGQDILRERDHATHCAVMLDGWSCRYQLLDGGRRQILSFHLPGDMPDLLSLHLDVLDHSLAALTPCVVALIPHDSLRERIGRLPGLAAALWRESQVDAAIFRSWITAIGRRSAYGRVAHLFSELYLRQVTAGFAEGSQCPMPLRHTDLADASGLTTVHISRTLRTMRSENLITLKDRTLIVHDLDRLYAAAEFDPIYLHLRSLRGAAPEGREDA